MSGLEGARCVGKWWLFESTDPMDHMEAAELCRECPVRRKCLELLHAEAATYPAGSPVGTWAGKLVGTTRKPREHGTERGWGQHRHYREQSCAACRKAHAEHNAARLREAAGRSTKAQVDRPFRTPVRVESESKVRVPHRRANDGEAAHSSTRPRGA